MISILIDLLRDIFSLLVMNFLNYYIIDSPMKFILITVVIVLLLWIIGTIKKTASVAADTVLIRGVSPTKNTANVILIMLLMLVLVCIVNLLKILMDK